jgi:hypothetical protein
MTATFTYRQYVLGFEIQAEALTRALQDASAHSQPLQDRRDALRAARLRAGNLKREIDALLRTMTSA